MPNYIYHIGQVIYNDEYLMHHGIKGQRWGVRRFQNSDGTYTNEGKQRRNVGRTPAEKKAIAAKKLKSSARECIDNIIATDKRMDDVLEEYNNKYSNGEWSNKPWDYLVDTQRYNFDKTKYGDQKETDLLDKFVNAYNDNHNAVNYYIEDKNGLMAQSEAFINNYGHKEFQKIMKENSDLYYVQMWKTFNDDKIDYDGWNETNQKYGNSSVDVYIWD